MTPIVLHDVNGDPVILGSFFCIRGATEEERGQAGGEIATVVFPSGRRYLPDDVGDEDEHDDTISVRETVYEIANLLDARSLSPLAPKDPTPMISLASPESLAATPGRILPSPTRSERRHEERHDEFKGEDKLPPSPIWSDDDGDDRDPLDVPDVPDDDSGWDAPCWEDV